MNPDTVREFFFETQKRRGAVRRTLRLSIIDPPANSDDSSRAGQARGGLFDSTPWSAVRAAGDCLRGNPANGSQDSALERLCAIYWPPLYAYVRRRVRDEHLAQDLTQSFFERLLTGSSLKMVDPARGRFRTFLIKAFDWHVANEFREERAIKRGGQCRILSLDFSCVDTLNDCTSLTAEQIFERQWALTLLNIVMEKLQGEQASQGKAEQFDLLKSFLVGEKRTGGYGAVVEKLGMTEAAARMAVSRLRSRYRELLREEILRTVAFSQDVADEIHQLFKAISQ